MSRKRSERAVKAARDMLAKLHAEGPEDLDLELIAMMHGAHVEWHALTNEDAHVRRIAGHLFIGLAESSRTSKKWRYDLGHEVAHLAMHGEAEVVSCPSVALRTGEGTDEERGKYWRTENEANDFASELLHAEVFMAPLMVVPPGVPFTFDDVEMIAQRFDMSFTSTAFRCTELAKETPCAFALIKAGTVIRRAMSEGFRGKLIKGRAVSPLALGNVLGEDGERVDGVVNGRAWGGAGIRGMREWSVRGNGIVMTWVWHPPG